jgi:HEAT repeat protein
LLALVIIAAGVAVPEPAEPPASGRTTESGTADAALQKDVLTLLERAPHMTPEILDRQVKALVSLGPRAAGILVEALGKARHVSQRAMIRTVLEELPSPTLDEELLAISKEHPGVCARYNAIWLLGELARADTLPGFLAMLDGNRPEEKRCAEAALVRLLERHDTAETYRTITKALPELSFETRCRVVSGVAAVASCHGAELLDRVLVSDPNLKPVVVSGLGRLSPDLLSRRTRQELRALLHDEDSSLRRESAMALGRAEDVDSVDDFVELLRDEVRGVREAAHWALLNTTGMSFPNDPDRWSGWLDSEHAWWEEKGRACVVALDSGDESEVLRAVVELSAGKRLFERTIVASLETLLDHESERVRGCVGAVLRARGCSTDGEAVGKAAMQGTVADVLSETPRPESEASPAVSPYLRPASPNPARRSVLPILAGAASLLLGLAMCVMGARALLRREKKKRIESAIVLKFKERPTEYPWSRRRAGTP